MVGEGVPVAVGFHMAEFEEAVSFLLGLGFAEIDFGGDVLVFEGSEGCGLLVGCQVSRWVQCR